ncbi:hypothetical protein B0T14DRAFT_513503 [Immersiella caudata]|uniref:BTB domain-containing protein n=1 Tax=Immersiella caudata TaxID=314043 RepID=A0AA40C7X1_9PEZI|nr:hypothetical protein B0T14DRAFT_513503 [Immersiella caudata]
MALQPARATGLEGKALSYDEIACSQPFRFRIGPNKREFIIHSALVTAQSPALDRLVNSDFKEAKDGHVELDNVDEDTFTRFIEYAYTGRYPKTEAYDPEPAPEPNGHASSGDSQLARREDGPVAESPEPQAEAPPAEAEVPIEAESTPSDWPWDLPPSKKKKKVTRVVMFKGLSKKFAKMVAGLEAEAGSDETCQVQGRLTTNPLLVHARIFVFADYWGITKLRDASLQKLGRALNEAIVVKRDVVRARIADLVEYCFVEARPDELQQLVILYAASRLPFLWVSERFREIYGDNKELSIGLTGAIIEVGTNEKEALSSLRS